MPQQYSVCVETINIAEYNNSFSNYRRSEYCMKQTVTLHKIRDETKEVCKNVRFICTEWTRVSTDKEVSKTSN